MLTADSVKIQNGYKIRGIAPPDLGSYDPSTRKLFWSWVVELGLKRKDKELSQGLDKDGKPLRPITAYTRAHRRSAMTPSGKGDPSAPPLTPGHQKSRTRSLLAGRALSTHADFFWKYDAWTGASWAEVLSYQAAKGRDVFGLSQAGLAWVKVQSWAKWDLWKKGTLRPPVPGTIRQAPAVPRIGRFQVEHIDHGMSASGGSTTPADFVPGKWTGWSTPEERRAYFRQTASAKLPGCAANPTSKSPESGPQYNRLLQHVWGGQKFPGRGGSPPAPAPPKPKPTPKPPKPAAPVNRLPIVPPPAPKPKPVPPPPRSIEPGTFQSTDELTAWAKARFPNAQFNHQGIPLENWNHLAIELDELAAEFPEIAGRLKWINPTAIDWSTRTTHKALSDADTGQILAFNPNYWSQPFERLHHDRIKTSSTNWGPKSITDPDATATHEWGHLYDAHLRLTDSAKREALAELYHEAGVFDKHKAAQVSQYGATRIEEAFAESFLAARRQPESVKSDIVKRFGELMK